MSVKILVVLDHLNEVVRLHNYDEAVWESPQDMTDEFGDYILNSNCDYMVVPEFTLKYAQPKQ